MTDLNVLSAQEIGRRLRVSRENANKRQAEAAEVIGMSPLTIDSIETGERLVRFDELQILANFYGHSVNAVMRLEAVHVNLTRRCRLNDSHSKGIADVT